MNDNLPNVTLTRQPDLSWRPVRFAFRYAYHAKWDNQWSLITTDYDDSILWEVWHSPTGRLTDRHTFHYGRVPFINHGPMAAFNRAEAVNEAQRAALTWLRSHLNGAGA